MEEKNRRDPDRLLAALREVERQQVRGKLRVYLGYAAGVGKTYAMLEAARHQAAEGVDVVVGYVETHGRVETDGLVAGLTHIPRRQIEYRGITLEEMDLDAILASKPQLVLVDELAHSNVEGSRHPKRYQDVQEILDAGIDVYTAINVQHLESMKETVARISAIVVSETVPDGFFDSATEVKVVDVSPQELLERLKEGKVYLPTQAMRALGNFFQLGNLIALRQITLRWVAERLDEAMLDYMQSLAIPGPWPARERLLICIDPRHEMGERLVRAGRRLADELYADWETVLVGPEAEGASDPKVRERSGSALRLAKTLGSAISPSPLQADARDIIEYARQNNVTRVLVGWPVRPRWLEVLQPHLTMDVIRHSGPIDVMVVTDEGATDLEVSWLPPVAGLTRWGYFWGAVASLAATGIGAALQPVLNPTNLVMLYLLAIVIVATSKGLESALVSCILSIFCFDFFFVPPRYSVLNYDPQYFVTFAVLLVVGVVISFLVAEIRQRAESARRRQAMSGTMYAFSRDLALAPDIPTLLASVIGHIQSSFDAKAVVLMPAEERLQVKSSTPELTLGKEELAVCDWVMEHGEPAGGGTTTLPGARLTCLPMLVGEETIGVIGLLPKSGAAPRTPEEERLLEALVSLAAMAVQRHLGERAQMVAEAQFLGQVVEG